MLGLATCISLNVVVIGTVGNVNEELDADGGKEPSFGPYITPPNSDPPSIFGEYGGNLDGWGTGSESCMKSASLVLRCVFVS